MSLLGHAIYVEKGRYVVRRWYMTPERNEDGAWTGKVSLDGEPYSINNSLENARKTLPAGLTRKELYHQADNFVEVWV